MTSPEIGVITAIIRGLIDVLVEKGTLTKSEVENIIKKGESTLEPDPGISYRAQAVEIIKLFKADLS
jgi:hypothetical protein